MILFSIYSNVKETFSPPFTATTELDGTHQFLSFIRQVPYEDKHLYELVSLGSFDENSGFIKSDINGVDVIKYEKVLYPKEIED